MKRTATPKNNRTCKIFFRVTPGELEIIRKRMDEVGVKNLSSYLRRLVLKGYVIEMDLTDFKEIRRLVGINGNNLNQYARRANEVGSIYKDDIAELQKLHKEIVRLISGLADRFNALKEME